MTRMSKSREQLLRDVAAGHVTHSRFADDDYDTVTHRVVTARIDYARIAGLVTRPVGPPLAHITKWELTDAGREALREVDR